jgi:hypothetical protein
MFDESKSESIHWKDPINVTTEQWMVLLEDKDIITEQNTQILKLVYACDGCKATAGQLAQLLGMPHHAPLNSQVGRLGKRIVKTLNIQVPKQKYGEGVNWWNVPFWGTGTKEGIVQGFVQKWAISLGGVHYVCHASSTTSFFSSPSSRAFSGSKDTW